MKNKLYDIFHRLVAHFGPLHWWPAETPFEVVIGAFLTQNTAWRNVEQAIANLRQASALDPASLLALPRCRLETLIRPAGFFRQKAENLQLFTEILCSRYGGDLAAMLDGDLAGVRGSLLSLRGVGPETADAILLYAGKRPSFVVDAYTRRLFTRLGLLKGGEGYEAIRAHFMDNLPHEVDLFNEYHALIVEECKTFCRKGAPSCAPCPLLASCPYGQSAVAL
jgi:endonuclease-3 related protein